MTVTCVTDRGFGLGLLCGEPAEVVTVGCLHEHVREVAMCRRDQLEKVLCAPCHDHPVAPHRCLISVSGRALSSRDLALAATP